MSLVNSALQAQVSPDNEYLQVSANGAAPAARATRRHSSTHGGIPLQGRVRTGSVPGSVAVSLMVGRQRVSNSLRCSDPRSRADEVHVHDFSVTSVTIGSIDEWRDQRRFSELVDQELAATGARAGIGRYDEVRAIYTTDLFRVEGNDGPEWRTVHIGIDVGAAPGTAIHAPLAGTIHSLRDNNAPGDYGPTVVLEHAATSDHPAFWTLYGHLSRESLETARRRSARWAPATSSPGSVT